MGCLHLKDLDLRASALLSHVQPSQSQFIFLEYSSVSSSQKHLLCIMSSSLPCVVPFQMQFLHSLYTDFSSFMCAAAAHIPAEHLYHTVCPREKKGPSPSIHPSRRSESMSERPRKGMQDEKCYRNAVLMKYVSKGKRPAVSSAGSIIYKNDS